MRTSIVGSDSASGGAQRVGTRGSALPAPPSRVPASAGLRFVRPSFLALAAAILGLTWGGMALSSCSGSSQKAGGESKGQTGDRKGKKGEGADKESSPKEFLTPIVAERVKRGEMLVTVSATANVVPVRSEMIQCMEGGILVFTRAWEEGDRVDSGTLVATLDNEDLRRQLETAQADCSIQEQSLQIQRIRLHQANREYVIVQELYSRGLAPMKDVEATKLSLENARNALRQAEINLSKARVALSQVQTRFQFLEMKAAFPGILVSRSTIEGRSGFAKAFGSEPLRSLEGRYVNKSTGLFGLMDTSRVILKCDVTSKDIAKVRLDQKALGVVYGKENIDVEGRVVSVSANVNPDTRAFEVAVLIDNPTGRLRPGMFGRVEIIVQQLEDVLAVTKTVVQRRGEQDIVFVVDRSRSLPHPVSKITPVELGVESKDRVEIKNGLKNGDELVIRGYEILQDQIPILVAFADEPTS